MANELKNFSYKTIVQGLISARYSIQDEIAIIRQANKNPEEFEEYYNFCEACKVQAKQIFEEQ